jgi:hypothetical protein
MSAPPNPLPFVKTTPGPRGALRTSFWAVKPSGDRIADARKGRELALAFMQYEGERGAVGSEGPSIIGDILRDIIAAGDRSDVALEFFATIVGCSVADWQAASLARFRSHYEKIDRDVDEKLAALRLAQSRQPWRVAAAPETTLQSHGGPS